MKKFEFEIAVWKEGKYYVAQCLNVEVASFGKTRKEALKNINEALDLYFEDAPHRAIKKIEKPEIIPLTLRYA